MILHMVALLKIVSFLIIVGLIAWVVWANTKPIPDEPCDYKTAQFVRSHVNGTENKKGSPPWATQQ